MKTDGMTKEEAQTFIACLMLLRHTLDASIETLMPVASKGDPLFRDSFTIPNYQKVPDSILVISFETVRRGDPSTVSRLLSDVVNAGILAPTLNQIARFGPPLSPGEEPEEEPII